MTSPDQPPSRCIVDGDAAALIDGDVSPRARDRALSHVDRCEDCRELLSALTRAAGDERRLQQPIPPADRSGEGV